MNKKSRDNRSNQLNPNNSAYWKSRTGNTPKGRRCSGSSGGYCGGPKYVSEPKRGFFGRAKGNYGWVICNHVGEWISTTSYVDFTGNYSRAVVFSSEKEAKKCANFFMRDSTSWGGKMPFLRIRCVEF